ncbi:MAG: glucoamylase family protein [Planctomycetota bacterium]
MKAFTSHIFAIVAASAAVACSAGSNASSADDQAGPPPPPSDPSTGLIAAQTVIEPRPGTVIPPFEFSANDEALLDEIQRGCFNFFWDAVSEPSGMVVDRTSKPNLVSVAGVGFQLSALPIGVERGWVSMDRARERALTIVRTLENEPRNRKAGLFFHYIDGRTGALSDEGYEEVVSTIDSALLKAGLLTASVYFGGEVAEICDRLFAEADWTFFAAGPEEGPAFEGFISLGWRSAGGDDPTAAGDMLRAHWIDSGCEHRLVTLLGVCAPEAAHRLDAKLYYDLRRTLGVFEDVGPSVYLPYSGALFTAFFSHCWIPYHELGTDNPAAHTDRPRARVDWWENSRRLAEIHRRQAIANPMGLATPGEHAWGMTACDGEDGYLVLQLFPEPVMLLDGVVDRDFPPHGVRDVWHDGTIAPYGAGSAIMFLPEESVASLRYHRNMPGPDGEPLLWEDPADGGQGFFDSYRRNPDGSYWLAHDRVAIDQGPLMLAIENARTGLIWDLFSRHRFVEAGFERLGVERRPSVP